MRKLLFLVLAIPAMVGSPVMGQIVLTSSQSPVLERFVGFDGSSAPAGWTPSEISFHGYSAGSATSGGLYSFGTDTTGEDTDRWLGIQFAGTPETATLSTTIVNNTGETLTTLSIAYDVFQFRSANNGRSSSFSVSLGEGEAIPGLTFTASTELPTGPRGGDLSESAFADRLTASIGGLAVLDGEAVTIHWRGHRGVGSGAAQGIGINNIEIAAIPEPAFLTTLLGGITLALVLVSRRRSH